MDTQEQVETAEKQAAMTEEQLEAQRQENLERIRGLRLMDDIFMTKCFEGDPKYIQLVLRIILNIRDLIVLHVQTQVFVSNLNKRSLRLDIVAIDSKGRRINVEIQRDDSGAGFPRARLHGSMMDMSFVDKGTKFDALPEIYIVFITEHDVIGKGLPVYHIERYIRETHTRANDGMHIVYANGAYRGDSPIGKLMHDFSCTDPDEMYYEELAERTRYFKQSKEGITTMSRILEEMCDEAEKKGVEKGRKEGMETNLLTNIKSLIETMQLTAEQAMNALKIPKEDQAKYRAMLG